MFILGVVVATDTAVDSRAAAVAAVAGSPMPNPAKLARRRRAKRLFDMTLIAATSLVWAPTGLAIAAALRLTSVGPVLFTQERIGEGGRVFRMVKFRTMSCDHAGEATTGDADTRVTPLGRWLRRHRLDELPQLWNVVAGDMSLVGPRPEQPSLVGLYAASLPDFQRRHALRPGITGLAQIKSAYASDLDGTRIKLDHDLDYLHRHNLVLDTWILLCTVGVVITGKGAR